MPALNLIFYFLLALGGFCIFINLLLSTFYGNAGLATSDSTDNQAAPTVVRFRLFSFPGFSLIFFFSGLSGLVLPELISSSDSIMVFYSFISGVLVSLFTGKGVTWVLELIRSKREGLESVVRSTGHVLSPIQTNRPGKIRIEHGNNELTTDAIEMNLRPVESGKRIRVIGIQRKTLIVEELP